MQSYTSVTLHIVFCTRGRKRYLDETIHNKLFAYLKGICNNSHCQTVAVGGHDDHIHVACKLGRTVTIDWLVEKLKKGSSRWIKTYGQADNSFAWQRDYSVFSVGQSQQDALVDYIENQKEYHHETSYEEELKEFFKRYHIPYSPKALE